MYESSEITRMIVLRISNGRRGESQARLAPFDMLQGSAFSALKLRIEGK